MTQIPQPKNIPQVFAIEGIDALGKSTLIDGIRDQLGYYEVIHFNKPQKLSIYSGAAPVTGVPPQSLQVYHYQQESFRNSMLLAKSGARIIFDRWHLGEVVYSPMYRFYDGSFVFDFERSHAIDAVSNLRLILLIEDFDISNHFIDDGQSLGTKADREEEQQRFLTAFWRSTIRDKRVICVTDQATGSFKPKDRILAEALA